MLGTLHEVVMDAEKQNKAVHLQRVPRVLSSLFEELSMKKVLRRVTSHPRDLPSEMKVVSACADAGEAERDRLRRAHEVLSSLSEANKGEFAGVLRTFESEVKTPDSS